MEAKQRENSVDMDDESQVLAQAESLADREQWREAASLLKRLGQVKSLSVNALGKLASYCSQSGDYDSAISFYKSLSEQQPSIAKWFYYLGFQYQQKEKWDDAIASYEKGYNLAPRWPLVALRLGETYQAAGESEKALEAYRKGMKSYLGLAPKWHNEINKSTYGY